MSLKVYVDVLSQPSRAVLILLKITKIPFEFIETRIAQAQQRTPEFTKINPAKRVPAILDGDFPLAESHTIMRYLIRSRNIQTTVYPLNDIKHCAKIDEYLDFHHTNTRKCSTFLFNKLFAPNLGLPVLINLDQAQKDVDSTLKYINDKILFTHKFIVGDSMTLADISAFPEIIQMLFLNFDFTVYPNISKWLKLMNEVPEVKEVHEIFYKMIKKSNPNPKL